MKLPSLRCIEHLTGFQNAEFLDTLAAAIAEDRGTIEDVVEPYLIQEGFLQRTSRGRVATRNAYQHFGLTAPSRNSSGLFD